MLNRITRQRGVGAREGEKEGARKVRRGERMRRQ